MRWEMKIHPMRNRKFTSWVSAYTREGGRKSENSRHAHICTHVKIHVMHGWAKARENSHGCVGAYIRTGAWAMCAAFPLDGEPSCEQPSRARTGTETGTKMQRMGICAGARNHVRVCINVRGTYTKGPTEEKMQKSQKKIGNRLHN